MLKRFLSFYKPHKLLFGIDIAVTLLSSALAILIPSMVRTLLQELIPDRDVKAIVVYCVLMIFIYLAKMVFEFIRMKMGEGAYPWCSHGV
ncbi:MAG: hypothetical protein KAR40_16760 [Candidatus Sabulitectum sp.]|nr:hypothetical protein [Candidatus Sabulitectum sp.]